MKVSYNWIKELTGVEWSPEELAERLTLAGTACETVTCLADNFKRMVVGQVKKVESVPGADRLKLATVNIGDSEASIICGAPNLAEGQKVAVATVGSVLPKLGEIRKVKKFGVESEGMLLSESELGLSDDHSGIMVLSDNCQPGDSLASVLQMDDYMLEFELTPDRPDSLSAIGIARDVIALAGGKLQRPQITLAESKTQSADLISVKIEDQEFCPRYAARIIKNITIAPSPTWLKSRLLGSGITPINNVVDITNYVLLEMGQPLHAFDFAHFHTGEVVVKRAKNGEKFTTLDEVEREADSSVLMITNGQEYLAAGGVMGGLKSSITADTQDVLLEAAYFSPSLIRKSRRKLGLTTDASTLFEKGADPNITVLAIDRAAQLLADLAGGEVCAGVVDEYPTPIEPLLVEIRPQRCNDILGADLTRQQVAEILSSLEFQVSDSGQESDPLLVTVPTFRPDISREIDLIEEVLRIRGIDAIPITTGYLISTETTSDPVQGDKEKRVRAIPTCLLACGFDEICGSGLADERLLEALDPGSPQVRLANPISDEFASMRNSLAYSLLAAARTNITHQVTGLRLFEIGAIYGANLQAPFHERRRVGLLATGEEERSWRSSNSGSLDFYTITGALERISREAGLPEFKLQPAAESLYSQGESFAISCGSANVGRIGAIKPEIARRFDIKQKVYLAEIDLVDLLQLSVLQVSYKPIPRYPSSSRDLALLVPEETLAGDIVAAIEKKNDGLIADIRVFDVFRGKGASDGKKSAGRKSIAIAIKYQSTERSLESVEVDGLQEEIIVYLKREFKAEIRA